MAALYQQARPITFDQVIGQEHVKDLLVASLQKGRIGHAYLFSGPRGVGKTTTARLLAMAVNCSNETTKPCGECESCMLVRQASHPDVIELDAASNNSVEDIRDLREKVNLASIRGGSRVWILDEAHMLTKSAANALLKTLEEPPSNLVFVLATTEPEKLPPTILSRCQHYRFRRLSEPEIAGKLQSLCEAAKIEAEDDAIALIARAADGAMRDGESLLERLLSQEKTITRQDAEEALGLPPQERIEALAKHLMANKLNELFSEAASLYRDGFAPRTLVERLKMSLRDAVYTKLKLDGYSFELENPEKDILKVIHALDEENERFTRHNDLFSLEVALIKAHNSLSDNEPGAGEVVITQSSAFTTSSATVSPPAPNSASTSSNTKSDNKIADFNPNARNTPAQDSTSQDNSGSAETSDPAPAQTGKSANWNDVKKRANAQLKAFLMPGKVSIEGSVITINFLENRHKFHFDQLKSRRDELRELVDDVLGKGYTIQLNGEGGNLTLKPDAADTIQSSAAGVSPQTTQAESPIVDEPNTDTSVKNESTIENSSIEETDSEDTPLITAVNIEASPTEATLSEIEKEPSKEKRSIKAPDTIPDDDFFDAKKPSKAKKQTLETISENDAIKIDDLDSVLPDSDTENEKLSGDFWGDDVGSVAAAPVVKTTVQEEKPEEIKSTETKPVEQVVETKVIEATPVQEKTIEVKNEIKDKVEAVSEAKEQSKQKQEVAPLTLNTPDDSDDEEVDDSELAVKARLEQLQILFPGEMSLIETFDKSDDSEITDDDSSLQDIEEIDD